MSKKRLAFVFTGTVFYVDMDEQDAIKWFNHYLTLKRSEDLSGNILKNKMVWGETWCVCLDNVVAVFITEAKANAQEKMIELMQREAGLDEPWRESLKINPDEEEENEK
jgi:hypothetical protein